METSASHNVVLICLDTVRKDFFDAIARVVPGMASLSYDQCRAASSWSVASHASMFTGQLPHEHGVHTYNTDFGTLTVEDVWLTDFDHHTTMNVSANAWLTRSFGVDTFFDEQIDVTVQQWFANGLSLKEFSSQTGKEGWQKYTAFLKRSLQHDYPLQSLGNGAFGRLLYRLRTLPVPTPIDDGANRVIAESLDLIEETTEPFFLFQNFMDAHGPAHHVLGYNRSLTDVPLSWSSQDFDFWDLTLERGENRENYREGIKNYRQLYRASIDYVDRKIGSFISTVQAKTDHETTFVITADHGENLAYPADDGLFNHVSSLSEGVLHVPLYIVNPPDGIRGRVDEYVSHLQLGALIKGLAHGEIPEIGEKRIAAEVIGGNPRIRDLARERGELEYWNRLQRCTYEGNKKYLWDSLGDERLIEIDPNRPCWQRERTTCEPVPEWVRGLFEIDIGTYDRLADDGSDHEFDGAVQSRLSDLGYV